MRILVVGAGALGTVIATKLTIAGVDTVALESNAAHAAICREPGVTVDLPDGSSRTTSLRVVERVDQLEGRFDYGLITLKAPAIPAVLDRLSSRAQVAAYVSLGNGLVQPLIAQSVGTDRLLIGTVSWGATFVRDGHVRQTTVAPFAIGEADPSADRPDRLGRLVEVLSHVAPVHVTERISGQVWSKLLLNSSLSGLGAVAGADYATVVGSAPGRSLALRMWTEGLRVAEALGEELDEVAGIDPRGMDVDAAGGTKVAGRVLDELMESLGATKSSMLQDLERGKATEVDVINGAVVRAGKSCSVPTPLNERCVEIIHACEAGAVRPNMENLLRFDCSPDADLTARRTEGERS